MAWTCVWADWTRKYCGDGGSGEDGKAFVGAERKAIETEKGIISGEKGREIG